MGGRFLRDENHSTRNRNYRSVHINKRMAERWHFQYPSSNASNTRHTVAVLVQ